MTETKRHSYLKYILSDWTSHSLKFCYQTYLHKHLRLDLFDYLSYLLSLGAISRKKCYNTIKLLNLSHLILIRRFNSSIMDQQIPSSNQVIISMFSKTYHLFLMLLSSNRSLLHQTRRHYVYFAKILSHRNSFI